MYKYEYLFDADKADIYSGSRSYVTVEDAEKWVTDPAHYETENLIEALRKEELEKKQERATKWEHFWEGRNRIDDHDCGTESGDGCQVCWKNQELAH